MGVNLRLAHNLQRGDLGLGGCGTFVEVPRGSNNSYFKKLAPEIVDLGGRSGRLPPKNQRAQVGGFAPHLRPWVFGRETAFSTPKIGNFWGRLLKIRVFGPLGSISIKGLIRLY